MELRRGNIKHTCWLPSFRYIFPGISVLLVVPGENFDTFLGVVPLRAVHWLLIVFPGWSSGLPAQHSRWPLWEVSGWVSWEQQYWRTGGVLLQLPLPAEGPVQQVSPFSSQFSLLLLFSCLLTPDQTFLFLLVRVIVHSSGFSLNLVIVITPCLCLCVVLLRVVCRRATGCSVCVCRVMLDQTVKGKRQHSVCLLVTLSSSS